MDEFIIEHPHNEASALTAIHRQAILDAFGWDVGFWIVSDEKPAHESLAALGRRKGGAWQVVPVAAKLGPRSDPKKTTDAETLARYGDKVYIFGSQYGSKEGPLDPKRHFIARFDEAAIRAQGGQLHLEMDVARPAFLLHRLINDALVERKIRLLERGPNTAESFVAAAVDAGRKKKKSWVKRLKPDDQPINIEGATFLPSGSVLFGLRYPVTADGHPILVEVDEVGCLFAGKLDELVVRHVFIIDNIGSADRPAGVRELDCVGFDVHVVTGNLDSDERSLILKDHPEGMSAPQEHAKVTLLDAADGRAKARHVRSFPADARVEGLALDTRGYGWYVRDDACIHLTRAPI